MEQNSLLLLSYKRQKTMNKITKGRKMCPEIIDLDTTINGNIKATLSTGIIIHDLTNVVCHSISTNRPVPICLHKTNITKGNKQ